MAGFSASFREAQGIEVLNLYIHGTTVFGVMSVLIGSFATPAAAFSAIFVTAAVVGFLGFGSRINGAVNKGSSGLGMCHGFSHDIRRQGRCDNRRGYGGNLHCSGLLQGGDARNFYYCLSVINKPLTILCNAFCAKPLRGTDKKAVFQWVGYKKGRLL